MAAAFRAVIEERALQLRARMRAVLLVLGIAACDGRDPLCTHSTDVTVDTTSADDPPLLLRVESCRVDVDACPTLCEFLRARGHSFATDCKVQFYETTAVVELSYDTCGGGQ